MSETRLLTADEVPLLLDGARSFFREFALPGALNESHFVASLRQHIRAGHGFVLAAGAAPFSGSIAGIVYPDFVTGEPTCMEFYWYVMPDRRGSVGVRLLRAFEAEAQRRGARRIMMMHLMAAHTDGFERLYTRAGYKLIEQVYSRELPVLQPATQSISTCLPQQ